MPLGKMILGIGGCVLWPLTISFIDDHSKQGQSPMLIGINLTVVLIGPIMAFMMAGVTLKKWVNFLSEDQPDQIDPKGSEWVGAWWLGYAIVIICLLIFSTPLAFFPRQVFIIIKVLMTIISVYIKLVKTFKIIGKNEIGRLFF